MKTSNLSLLTIVVITSSTLLFSTCKKDTNEPPNINNLVYSPTSSPQGISYAEWSKLWWNWVMSSPCATNPTNDQQGNYVEANQSGPVFFLAGAGITGSLDILVVRNVTIPSGKDIFFPIFNYINDYPCPDTSFHPAAGESLENFLKSGAKSIVDMAGSLEVSLDEIKLNRPIDYRISTNVFYFTGNADLINCLDPCVTGTSQAGVSDGYWVMLKALSKGTHTLRFKSGVPAFAWNQDVKYNLTIQ